MFTLDEAIHDISEADDIINEAKLIGKCKTNKKIEYYNIVCAFDIETTSFIEDDQKRSVMYVWQFAIDGHVIIGRTWADFLYLIDRLEELLALSPEVRLLVFVHNLNFLS